MKKGLLIAVSITALAAGLANEAQAKWGHQTQYVRGGSTWHSEEQKAFRAQQDGDFDEAEKHFLLARKALLKESEGVPPSSFQVRWFPLQDALRKLYLDRAINEENSLPFDKVDDCYKKAIKLPGASYDVWQAYARFLKRKGKIKQAQKALKEGKKKSLYDTN